MKKSIVIDSIEDNTNAWSTVEFETSYFDVPINYDKDDIMTMLEEVADFNPSSDDKYYTIHNITYSLEDNTIETMNKLIDMWLVEHGIDKLDPELQIIKVIEEVGELAKAVLKQDKKMIKDSIGDIYIALRGFRLQKGFENEISCDEDEFVLNTDVKDISLSISLLDFGSQGQYIDVLYSELKDYSQRINVDFIECVEMAYNEVKDRKIKIIDGVATK